MAYSPRGGDRGEGGVVYPLEGLDWFWAGLGGGVADWSSIDRLADFIALAVIFGVSDADGRVWS